MKKGVILLLILTACSNHKNVSYDKAKYRRILKHKNSDELIHVTFSKNLKVKDKLLYTWFKAGAIQSTYGGYSGLLLQGLYTKYDLKGSLLKKGYYVNGLKDDLWKQWYPSGILKKKKIFKKGILQQERIYNNKRELISFKNFRTGYKVRKKFYGFIKSIFKNKTLISVAKKENKVQSPQKIKKSEWSTVKKIQPSNDIETKTRREKQKSSKLRFDRKTEKKKKRIRFK